MDGKEAEPGFYYCKNCATAVTNFPLPGSVRLVTFYPYCGPCYYALQRIAQARELQEAKQAYKEAQTDNRTGWELAAAAFFRYHYFVNGVSLCGKGSLEAWQTCKPTIEARNVCKDCEALKEVLDNDHNKSGMDSPERE